MSPRSSYLDQIEEVGLSNATEDYTGPKLHDLAASSPRRPFRVSPEIFIHNSSLRALTERLLKETWCINGAQGCQVSGEEARLRMGPVGKSIFLAYARRMGVAPQTLWGCLICEALDGSTNQLNPGYTHNREDRILKHIHHHFEYRPWFCSGRCGTTRWYSHFAFLMLRCCCLTLISKERFLSKYNLDVHQRRKTKFPCNRWYGHL